MAHLRAPIRGALLLFVALAITLDAALPALAADARDLRCAAWEAAASPPPGINPAVVCPPAEVRTEVVDLDKEPLLPYVVGLVVMAGVLGLFGVIAMRFTAPRPDRHAARPQDWWACPSCGVRNRPDRAHCFACESSRDATPALADATVAPPASEGPHPA